MKNNFKISKNLLLIVIFMMINNFAIAQSVYRESTKETKKKSTNNSTKADDDSVFTDEELALIDYYSDPKNKKEIEKISNTLEKVKPLGNNFYTITELASTKEHASKKFKVFETAFAAPSTNSEKVVLLEGIIKTYQSASNQVDKAYVGINNYSEKDKKTITNYKDYYSKVLGILKELLDFTK